MLSISYLAAKENDSKKNRKFLPGSITLSPFSSEYDSVTGIERLRVNWITKSQAAQRAGRANREGKGLVLRLYTDEEYEKNMASFPPSQMLTTPTDDVLLNLFALGIRDLETFPWLEKPNTKAIKSGLELLHRLGAIISTPATNSLSNGYLNGHSYFSNTIPRQISVSLSPSRSVLI